MSPIKRHRHSFLRLVNLILLALAVVCLNFVSCHRHAARDLTQDQRFSLSPQTLRFLASPAIQDRQSPIKITFIFRRTTPFYSCMRALLEEYERASNNKIHIQLVEPVRNTNLANLASNTYDIPITQNLAIVDARPNSNVRLADEAPDSPTRAHVRFIPGDDLLVMEPDPARKNQLKVTALNLENSVTGSINSAIEGKPRKFYVAADKTTLNSSIQGKNSPWQRLTSIATQLNLQLAPISLATTPEIPADAAGLAILGPLYDLSPSEIQTLTQYWIRPDSSLFILLNPRAPHLKLFHRFLREHTGLNPRQDRVMRASKSTPIYDAAATFLPNVDFTRDFWNHSTLVEGESSSLEIRQDDKLANARVNPFPLLVTSPQFYGESKFTTPPFSFDPNEDTPAPAIIAAAAERGNTSSPDLASKTSRLVLINNIDFLNPKNVRDEQLDFVRSSLSWLINRQELAGIGGSRDLSVKLSLHPKAQGYIQAITIAIIPCFSLLIALLVWRNRKQ